MISSMAWLPVFFLYFSENLSLRDVLLLEAVYYISIVILEVPSGYFSDVVGRKRTLVFSAIFFSLAYFLFFITREFEFFVAAQFLLAGGMAFLSGTGTSFHFESLKAIGKEDEYGEREAKVYTWRLAASSVAVLSGGLIAHYGLQYPYALSFLTAIPALAIALLFKEPTAEKEASEHGLPFIKQLIKCFSYLKQAPLGWLFGFAVLLYVLIHVPYEYYQPYLGLLEAEGTLTLGDAPLISGILYALTSAIAAFAAGYSIKLRDKLGLTNLLLIALFIQLGIIALIGSWLHPAILLVILFRNLALAITDAPVNAAIAPRVETGQRATYFSLQSLTCRLAFFATLFTTSFFVEKEAAISWPVLSSILLISAGIGLALALVLVAFSVKNRKLIINPDD